MKPILIIVFSLFTLGLTAQTVILSTDFQQGMPANYTIVDNDGNTPDPAVAEYTSAWITVVDPENTLDTVAASTSFFTAMDSASRWMILLHWHWAHMAITLNGMRNHMIHPILTITLFWCLQQTIN